MTSHIVLALKNRVCLFTHHPRSQPVLTHAQASHKETAALQKKTLVYATWACGNLLPPTPPLPAALRTQLLGYAYVGHPADLTVPDAQLVLPRSGVLSFCRASQQSKVVAPQQVSTLLNWVCKATTALQALSTHLLPSCLAEQQGLQSLLPSTALASGLTSALRCRSGQCAAGLTGDRPTRTHLLEACPCGTCTL